MHKISVVIITLNEEKNIQRCLNAVKDIADEIVVVDSFSTDKTKEICLQHKVRFIEHRFEGHIEQKNWAAAQATYDFVLSLDADEVVSEELKQSILEVKANKEFDGYYFNRLTSYCGQWIKHCGWYPDKKLRLWDRRLGSWTGINPHDRFELQAGYTQKYLKGDLLHYTYNSISEHVAQYNKFTEIGAREAFKKGKKSNLFIAFYKSVWKFKRDYIFKLGFLDGYYGFIICRLSANATFLKYIKLRELIKDSHKNA